MKGADHEYSKVPVCVLAKHMIVLLSAHGSMNKATNKNNILCRIYDIYGGLQLVFLGMTGIGYAFRAPKFCVRFANKCFNKLHVIMMIITIIIIMSNL